MGPLAAYKSLRGRKCFMGYTFFNVPKCLALLGRNYMPLSKRFNYLNAQFMVVPFQTLQKVCKPQTIGKSCKQFATSTLSGL